MNKMIGLDLDLDHLVGQTPAEENKCTFVAVYTLSTRHVSVNTCNTFNTLRYNSAFTTLRCYCAVFSLAFTKSINSPSSWDHQARLCHRLRGHQVKI